MPYDRRHMPSSHDFRLSCKRQRREHPSETSHHQLKKQKLSQSYWDNLSKYPVPQPMSSRSSSHHRKRRAESPPSSTTANTKTTTKTSSTSAYSRNFQQNLIDHRVYPPEYRYPDSEKPLKPNNWMKINEMLTRSRASLSPSKFSEKHFEDFREADAYASKEKPVTVSVVPILDSNISDLKCVGGNYLFGNLAPLTDDTLTSARPDHFYDTHPEQLNHQICKELSSQIVPSMQDDLSIAPNFFLEVKGPDRSLAVTTHQACYDGALGARGMHLLQSYKEDESIYNNNVYTLTLTYHGGQLKLYTTHLIKPSGPDYCPEYIMTQLNMWDDSDISTVTDETEDAQWSFAAANKDVEDETQILSRNPKKSRVGDLAGNKITRRLN
ncbi:hypothetical protein BDDG_06108 [Blastomyces dermatitidis ATCC 18188]|uniref:Uncharacterized protein n=1 Tax=Ajellomyces dermatitidis (strain ATCC 18188 / CBS 674.68) TaxID=653446 RepID=F2TIV1_AJEDA|nr:hypothetical protein BDDG_06108 [Blastomyces dermatitidis ATCC 18188]